MLKCSGRRRNSANEERGRVTVIKLVGKDGEQISEVQVRPNIRGRLTFCQFHVRKDSTFPRRSSLHVSWSCRGSATHGLTWRRRSGNLVRNEGEKDGQRWVVIRLFKPSPNLRAELLQLVVQSVRFRR